MYAGEIYFEKAEEIAGILAIANFVDSQKNTICEKIKSFYLLAKAYPQPDVAFVGLALPLISGVIHVGSTVDNFRTAVEQIKRLFPGKDDVSVLSRIVLAYVVNKLYLLLVFDKGNKAVWEEIINWLEHLA